MADGSHGWRPNCADFPVAAASRPIIGRVLIVSCWAAISCMLIDDVFRSQAVVIIRPMSPIRL